MASFTPQQIEQFLQEFFDVVGSRQYIGARYVPVFGHGGNTPIEWDNSEAYEPLSIVYHIGTTYTSRQYVPAGVEITDTDYWVVTANYNAQVEHYRQEVLSFQGQINEIKSDYVPFPDSLVLPKYGTLGQVLTTLGDGTTEWENPVVPDAELTGAAVNAWLDDHPEATTTVVDGSITNVKIHDDTITDEKLVQSGGILSTVDGIDDRVTAVESTIKPIHNIRNIVDPATIVEGKYYDATGILRDAATWHCASVAVKPETEYSIFGVQAVYTSFAYANGTVISQITTTGTIQTPIGCELMYLSGLASNDLVLINYPDVASGTYTYDETIRTIIDKLDLLAVPTFAALNTRVVNVEGTVKPIHNVRNIVNPATIIEGKYYDATGILRDAATWHCASVAVIPETEYSIFGVNAVYTSFARADGTVISQITATGTIQTPANCELMYLSGLASNDLVLINYPDVASGAYTYDETIRTIIDELDLSTVPTFAALDTDFRNNTVNIDDDVLIDATRTVIENPILCDTDEFRQWGSWGTVTHNQDGSITYTPSTTNNGGIYTKNLTCPPSNLLRVKSDITQLNCTLRLILFGTKQDSSSATLVMDTYTEPTEVDFTIDLTYQSIYNNLDLTKNITVGFIVTAATSDGTNVIFDNVTVYDNQYPDIAGKNVADAISEANEIANAANNQISSLNISSFTLTSSDGDRYFLQVSNGNVVATPVIPEKVVFIGNSLLFGFQTFGMAASNNQEDYYALVTDYLDQHATSPSYAKVYGSPWERSESLAAQETWCATNLLPELGNDIDLVIIQLGDNVNANTSIAFFEQASKNLVSYIRTNAPNARVAWVAEWYSTEQKQQYIANACSMYGATFVDIGMLYADVDNRAKIGDVITYPDSSTRVITDPGVASHPSSVGMAKIANIIIDTLFE